MSDPKTPPPQIRRSLAREPRGRRIAIVKGQDRTRFTDLYHGVLTAPWWAFFLGLAAFFTIINIIFALLYLADPGGLAHARHGNFWDAFLFSIETMGSVNYTVFVPQSIYANIILCIEAFFGILTIALFTGVIFARFSRPFARVVFSKVAIIAPFEGVPTLVFRAANQRGNQIIDAEIRISLAHQQMTREGISMRRFTELVPVRSRSSLFALSWSVMHTIDENSPLYGVTADMLYDQQMEIILMLSGVDETLANRIYARHSYFPDEIVWDQRFVDVLSVSPHGRRIVDLSRFHDTEPLAT